jgi:hypothetical protein
MDDQLTDAQVENWRKMLAGMIGPRALIMPREEVERHRQAINQAFKHEEAMPQRAPGGAHRW